MSVNAECSLWPAMPEEWQELDAELTEALNTVPILGRDECTPQQLEAITYADNGISVPAMARATFRSEGSIKDHRQQLMEKVGAGAMSGVLYAVHRSGWGLYEPIELESLPQRPLTPRRSLLMKYIALGTPGDIINECLYPGKSTGSKGDMEALKAKLRAPSDRNVLIRRGFEFRMYFPVAGLETDD